LHVIAVYKQISTYTYLLYPTYIHINTNMYMYIHIGTHTCICLQIKPAGMVKREGDGGNTIKYIYYIYV
jgi:hypothetical protein